MRRALAAAAVMLALAAPSGAEGGKTSPTLARDEAESNAKTPAGRRYQSALDSSLDRWLRQALERCVKGVSKDEVVSFDVLVRIGESGRAEEVVLDPETAVGRCVAPEFQEAKYPSPPQAGWWVRIGVGLR